MLKYDIDMTTVDKFWHGNLRVLPKFTAADLNSFNEQNKVVPNISSRGFKFYQERYIFNYQREYSL